MFNLPLRNMFGFNNTKVSLKGAQANRTATFLAKEAVEEGKISPDQAASVSNINELTEVLKQGYRKPAGVVYEDAEGNVHTEYTATKQEAAPEPEVKSDHEPEEEIGESEVDKETKTQSDEDVAAQVNSSVGTVTEVDAQPKKAEAKEEPKPGVTDPLVIHWNEIWNAEGVVDLNTKKAKWPNEVKSRIKEPNIASFFDKCGNGTGYYDDLKSKDLGVKTGTILKGTSGNGRRVVIVAGGKTGNLVVFERYSDTPMPLVAHLPDAVEKLIGHDTSALTDYELRIFFGGHNFTENNVMIRIAGLVDL